MCPEPNSTLPLAPRCNGNEPHFLLTVDLEDWYHLTYLVGAGCDESRSVIDHVGPFLDALDERGVRMTVFVLGEIAARHQTLLRKLVDRGHELGIHGWDHALLYGKAADRFTEEVRRAKDEIENLTGVSVSGFRASCFSMDDQKLDLLRDVGFRYDSSYTRFRRSPEHRPLKLHGFERVSELLQKRDDFFELEVPTLSLFGINVPVSGGGYFRALPEVVFEQLFRAYHREGARDFLFYVHPFELTDCVIRLPAGLSRRKRWRFSVGREQNPRKLLNLLRFCSARGFRFVTCRQYIETRVENLNAAS